MANSKITRTSLSRHTIVISVSEMTQKSGYYEYTVQSAIDYIEGVLIGWNGTNVSPFSAMYDPRNKKVFCIFGTIAPTSVHMELCY